MLSVINDLMYFNLFYTVFLNQKEILLVCRWGSFEGVDTFQVKRRLIAILIIGKKLLNIEWNVITMTRKMPEKNIEK